MLTGSIRTHLLRVRRQTTEVMREQTVHVIKKMKTVTRNVRRKRRIRRKMTSLARKSSSTIQCSVEILMKACPMVQMYVNASIYISHISVTQNVCLVDSRRYELGAEVVGA